MSCGAENRRKQERLGEGWEGGKRSGSEEGRVLGQREGGRLCGRRQCQEQGRRRRRVRQVPTKTMLVHKKVVMAAWAVNSDPTGATIFEEIGSPRIGLRLTQR